MGSRSITIYDPRFAEVQLPELKEELDRVKLLEAEVHELKTRIAHAVVLEEVERMVSFQCSRSFKNNSIIQCKTTRRTYGCHCEALKIWIAKWVLDD